MFSFQNQRFFRVLIYGLALLITAGSLWYSNSLVSRLAVEEEMDVQLYAESMEFIGSVNEECDVPDNCETNFVFNKITRANDLIPTLLVTEDGTITGSANLGIPPGLPPEDSLARVKAYLEELKSSGAHKPIEIEFYGTTNYVYYDESTLLKRLRLFPYLQLVLISIFIIIIFAGFFVAKKNEQNRVWVGLAKETAHQLGTPVSSLMAWIELLKLKLGENPEDAEMVAELGKDVERLQIITERFSKIGSVPELTDIPLSRILNESADYMRKRKSRLVTIEVENTCRETETVPVNLPLFQWVLENLVKNALDAIDREKGRIRLIASASLKEVYIDVEDNGKGMPKSMHNQVFKPGFTTKKRGWGLGLSLTKRIVENYHQGRIFVKHSEPGKGTTFRVVLPKQKKLAQEG
ncbi:MAG: HAMP domain-containing histidine kinase [Bacteroidia bacterium]|nr:HAMP domain-containing histidine kinase [Bacteroidia bacterium]